MAKFVTNKRVKKELTPVIFRGQIILASNGEETVLYLLDSRTWDTGRTPLAKELANYRWNKPFLSVKYYVSDIEIPEDKMEATYLKYLYGENNSEYCMHYSDLTGFLFTTEEIVIGGHDLMKELRTHLGKWLHMEIIFYSEKEIPEEYREIDNG